MREIVTIQVGGYANFIGSHFWNFQDELLGLAESPESDQVFKNHGLNMDAIYRIGETQQGVQTYTPRLVSVGFQGSLGSMSSCGTLYNEVQSRKSDVITWTGNVTTHASEAVKKNLFLQSLCEEEQDKLGLNVGERSTSAPAREIQDKDIVDCLEKDVQYWTDFSKVHYHPQSLYELGGLWMDSQDFNNFGIGRNAFCEGVHSEEINERLRFFVEECDHIQGMQFIVDDSGGFSGVAAEFLENIADDYTNIPVLLYAASPPGMGINPSSRKLTVSRSLHDAVSFSSLSALCKLIVPIGLPTLSTSKACRYLCIEDEKPYHSSAIYASALHSISLPFRMEPLGPTRESYYASGALDMNEVIHILAGQGRQNMVTTMDLAMPTSSISGNQIKQPFLDNLQSLTPEIADDVEDLQALECMTVLGVFGSGLERASISSVKDAVHAAYESAVTKPRFSHLSIAQCPLPIPLPFPSIFGNVVGQHGELLPVPVPGSSRGSLDVHSVPLAARLRSSTAVLPFLENRLSNLRKYGLDRGAIGSELLRSWGFGRDEVEEVAESLSKMVHTLNPYSEMSSDSD